MQTNNWQDLLTYAEAHIGEVPLDQYELASMRRQINSGNLINLEHLLSQEEAAEILKCSKRHLEDLRNRGGDGTPQLKYYKLGRRVRYKASDIQDYIKACSH